jgi:hypothetical protein
VVAAGEFFSFLPDWHEDDRARPVVRQYQTALDAILRNHPGLASCAVHCRHCSIRFLTHPRNASRQDLHCPFGCREHHRRQQANERSKNHYRTDEGRRNKKLLNAKRSAAAWDQEAWQDHDAVASEITPADSQDASCADTSAPHEDVTQASCADPTHQTTQVGLEESFHVDVKLALDGFTLDEATLVDSPILPYLAMVATVIEGRTIRADELLSLLLRSMRQHSFDKLPRREYVLRFLDQHPP